MARRGRPSEQFRRETDEGRIWRVISILIRQGDFTRTARDVATQAGCSLAAVGKNRLWKEYKLRKCSLPEHSQQRARVSRHHHDESVEGRVYQIIRVYSNENDFSLTVRRLAEIVGCSPSAVGKTEAWKVYVKARAQEVEAAKARMMGPRIM